MGEIRFVFEKSLVTNVSRKTYSRSLTWFKVKKRNIRGPAVRQCGVSVKERAESQNKVIKHNAHRHHVSFNTNTPVFMQQEQSEV